MLGTWKAGGWRGGPSFPPCAGEGRVTSAARIHQKRSSRAAFPLPNRPRVHHHRLATNIARCTSISFSLHLECLSCFIVKAPQFPRIPSPDWTSHQPASISLTNTRATSASFVQRICPVALTLLSFAPLLSPFEVPPTVSPYRQASISRWLSRPLPRRR